MKAITIGGPEVSSLGRDENDRGNIYREKGEKKSMFRSGSESCGICTRLDEGPYIIGEKLSEDSWGQTSTLAPLWTSTISRPVNTERKGGSGDTPSRAVGGRTDQHRRNGVMRKGNYRGPANGTLIPGFRYPCTLVIQQKTRR